MCLEKKRKKVPRLQMKKKYSEHQVTKPSNLVNHALYDELLFKSLSHVSCLPKSSSKLQEN